MSVVDRLPNRRLVRLVEFCGVGAVGMAVDLAITFALLGRLDPLVANAAGFAVAVTHNFAGNWWLTFDKPDGRLGRQYLSYVGLHLGTFAVRAVVLTALLATTPTPATVATLLGVGAAALVNFVGTETIFDADGTVWFSVVDAANHVAHTVYRSPIRRLLLASGLYTVVFGIYARGLAAAHPGSTRQVEAGDATAEVAIDTPTETVSVLHTLEKESAVLDRFAADVRQRDTVLDVGANVGVYSAVAAAQGAAVLAVEPHPPTVARLRQNCPAADVRPCVCGPAPGSATLGVCNDAAGTQRPAVADEGTYQIPQVPADRFPAPDVAKIDVEGAECEVLAGFKRTLAESPPRVIYVETHGDRTAAVRERLVDAGYAVEAVAIGADETMLRGEQ